MKCINKHFILCLLLAAICCFGITGCGRTSYDMPYDINSDNSSFTISSAKLELGKLDAFASNVCVASSDVNTSSANMEAAGAAALFDLRKLNTKYAKNCNLQMHPASLTKVMTALVALKHCSTDQVLVASENVLIADQDAQICNLKPGDKMTLDQALRVLLVYSANDVAIMIAENVAGSVDAFVQMMNDEAKAIGATNSHFLNPNGLTEDGHYVTAYDMYLIFNEALKYSIFNEIIQMSSYSTIYTDTNGTEKSLDLKSTNYYTRGDATAPESVTVIGGKTGSTSAAGHCLILYVKDSSGNPYVSVLLKTENRDTLYSTMNQLLELVK